MTEEYHRSMVFSIHRFIMRLPLIRDEFKSIGFDKNHNPRKGTETLYVYDFFVSKFNTDKNHNPRKGTYLFER